jgi:hypothetical protein
MVGHEPRPALTGIELFIMSPEFLYSGSVPVSQSLVKVYDGF